MNNTVFIDLTYPIEEGMTTFAAPWHPEVSIRQLGRLNIEGRETREVCLGTHTGTHADAPRHFIKDRPTIDQIPLEKLIGKVTIIDFSNLNEDEAITEKMLAQVQISKKMVFKFGWGEYWGNRKFYKGYPYFTNSAAKYLVSKGIELIGLDSPSPDDSRNKLTGNSDSPVHKIFLENGIVLVEYLANLDKVEDYKGWNIIVMPLKIKDGDGAPVRVCVYK
ncbi:MAG: cyclase [Gammaproteobacteria bacterium]|jgi:arylformamidase|nr:cyclase [Gammaproteobacteria bacterium]HJP17165.1 cyclase family protein [Nitrospinota bacterium]|tara:strand:+ start:53683 stop:54342 length:660 start_codon:yes stop_codon:yes gene_type:complete